MSKKYYIYKFLDKNNNVIYIGRSENIEQRIATHFSPSGHLPKKCYKNVKSVEYIEVDTKIDMFIMELYYINKFKPIYNTADKYEDEIQTKIDESLNLWKEYDKDNIKIIQNYIENLKFETQDVKMLTEEDYWKIMNYVCDNDLGFENQEQFKTILMFQANSGTPIKNTLNVKLSDFFEKTEICCEIRVKNLETNKKSKFPVHTFLYQRLKEFSVKYNIKEDEFLFNMSINELNNYLNLICADLNLDSKINIHSFRKFFATMIYYENNYRVELIEYFLQDLNNSTFKKYVEIY